MEDNQFEYSQFVKIMYEKGYYVERYTIDLTSHEIYFADNRIFIVPESQSDEDTEYVFTGTLQKAKTLSDPTEFRLYLEDTEGKEFEDSDNIMLSTVKINEEGETINNLYTRNYSSWKFGIILDKGIYLDSKKYLMFQPHRKIGTFKIEINNIDLFRKKVTNNETDRMEWLG